MRTRQDTSRSDGGTAGETTLPAGHLGVHIEGQHPNDVSFMFERGRARVPGAAVSSVVFHVVALVLILLGLHDQAAPVAVMPAASVVKQDRNIVWLTAAGPGGGGGGGGNGMKAPPRRAELPGRDQTTVPVVKPRPVVVSAQTTPQTDTPPPAIPQLDIAAVALARGTQAVVGTLDGVPDGTSRGPGTGDGAGRGNGKGIGDGLGNGLGDGSGRNTGGGPYRPGNGIEDPKPVYTPNPVYTAGAMQARIEGTAIVECVVQADGTVSDAHVVRSLDARYGLDTEAIKAASRWRFIPARLRGQPVPMLIAIYVTFSLR